MKLLCLQNWFFLFTGLTGLAICTAALAADFSLENHVYSGDAKEPGSLSRTVFYQAVVYDFLQNPAETIVLDKAAGRFIILDDNRKIRTELTTNELDSFTQKLKDRAGKLQDPLMQFFAEPVFEEHFDTTHRELTLHSDLVSYKVILTSVDNPAIAAQYREFSDWYARLNAILIPGSRPPFARLRLNEALASREAIAREVILTINSVKDGKTQPATVRSEHNLSLTLTPADMEHIQHARQSITGYKPVSFEKYRQAK